MTVSVTCSFYSVALIMYILPLLSLTLDICFCLIYIELLFDTVELISEGKAKGVIKKSM